ncbi:replication initiation factor domain-containing protein [Streptococcus suis]|uniref:Replication initiation factor domain-containing protein n=3 Tax=Streptococcus suis TaxID=1307 RepID=A0AAW5LUU8_STRSU|nr:replication initiation factor domain-containing protein [Streptococcus suis]MCR1233621.1 replication initiation factor domain-containing protein [Streptococcus suis]
MVTTILNNRTEVSPLQTYLIDWLNVVIPVAHRNELSVEGVKEILESIGLKGLQLEESKGRYSYDFGLTAGSIHICFGNPAKILSKNYEKNMLNRGILLEFSGSACRDLETTFENSGFIISEGWKQFLNTLIKRNARITRIDIARDMREKVLDHQLVTEKLANGEYVARFRNSQNGKSITQIHNLTKNGNGNGWTIYLGSRSGTTKMFIRYYSKSHEQNLIDFDSMEIPFWERFEICLRKEKANEFVHYFVNGTDIDSLFCGVVSDYITFLDNEKGNMIPSSWWLTFVGENSKIQLKAPKRTINIMNTLNWVDRSILGTLTGLQMISNELGIDFYQILKNSSKRDSNACRRLLEEFDRLGTQEKRRIRERISSLSGFEY